jgi:hypothetical protein
MANLVALGVIGWRFSVLIGSMTQINILKIEMSQVCDKIG